MARKVKDSSLQSRSNRLKLPIERKPMFVRIGPGMSLGYRRNKVAGTWVVRLADGKGGASTKAIGVADDYDEADGVQVLTFWQAQDVAKEKVKAMNGSAPAPALTVARAVDVYLSAQSSRNPKAAKETRGRLRKHFLAKFGDRLVTDLTKTELETWHGSMVSNDIDPETVRKSKDSANRVLSMVKAVFNHAMRDPSHNIADDRAWRLVRPFKGVGEPRRVHFSLEEAQRLIEAATDQAFAKLLTAGLLTGARYGELIACRVTDYDKKSGTLHVAAGKTGSRTIILQSSAVNFFDKIVGDRHGSARLLVKADGAPWGNSHQQRPMAEALKKAGLDENGTFYALRHTYISRSIEGGVPLNVIAENCGTSVRMIEKTYGKMLAETRRSFIDRGAPALTV